MGSLAIKILPILLIAFPWLCMCENAEVAKNGESRATLNLNDSNNQLYVFAAAIIALDIILTIFAFGYIQTQERRKYKRVGVPPPYFNRNYTPLSKIRKAILGSRPIKANPNSLGSRIVRKLRPKSYYINGYKSFVKRTGQQDIDTQGEFRPTIDHEFNDAQIQQSIDLVDSTFGVMNIDSEPCRKRTICEMERVATKYPIVSFIVKTVSPYVKGLSKYDDAVQRGANGEDCALYYNECPYTLDKLPKFF